MQKENGDVLIEENGLVDSLRLDSPIPEKRTVVDIDIIEIRKLNLK